MFAYVVIIPLRGQYNSAPRGAPSSWLAPAPSQVTMTFRRRAGGRASMASRSSRRWSAAVLLPAEPGRSIQASGSAVLSQAAMIG